MEIKFDTSSSGGLELAYKSEWAEYFPETHPGYDRAVMLREHNNVWLAARIRDEFSFMPSYDSYRGTYFSHASLPDGFDEKLESFLERYRNARILDIWPIDVHFLRDMTPQFHQLQREAEEKIDGLAEKAIVDSFEWIKCDAWHGFVAEVQTSSWSLRANGENFDEFDDFLKRTLVDVYSGMDEVGYDTLVRKVSLRYRDFESMVFDENPHIDMSDLDFSCLDKADGELYLRIRKFCLLRSEINREENVKLMLLQRWFGKVWADPGHAF